MASLSDVSPAWCSPAAMLLANDRDGSLIIFVTEFVVVVLCNSEAKLIKLFGIPYELPNIFPTIPLGEN